MNVEKEYVCLLLLDNPKFCKVNESTTVDEHKHFDTIVDARLLYPRVKVRVGGDWIDFILDVFAFKHFLAKKKCTDSILRVQTESTSTPTNITIET